MRFAVILVALACVAFAATDDELRTTSISVTLPANGPVVMEHAVATDLFAEPRVKAPLREDIDIDKLIAIGKKIWEIVKAGQPVVDYKNDWAGVVPKNVEWMDLEGFKDMTWGPFGWTFKNTFGMTTVEFKFHFSFSCKGSYNGHGGFLMNVGTAIEKIYAAWGFTVNINALVDQNPINYGTKIDPVAGLAIEVTLEVKSVIQSFTERCRVTVRGDCTGKVLACGN